MIKKIKIILPPDRKNWEKDGIKFSEPNCACVVLLITQNNKKILFDTGAFGYKERLLSRLEKEGLKPEDIDYVILSHAHFDHYAHICLFVNAQLVQHKWLVSIKTSKTQKFPSLPEIDIKGLEIIPTPGHTEDSISIICDYQGEKWAIAGDAVKAGIIEEGNRGFSKYSDPSEYLANMKKLFNLATVIISGEDGVIKGNYFKELKEKLNKISF